MSDLRELYQEVILDHSKRPRNFRQPADANRLAVGHNPLCGDKLSLFLKVDGGRVADAAFQGSGCAISTASASLMTEMVKGRSETEARTLFEKFHAVVAGDAAVGEELERLSPFAGVREFPVRVKCATLAWHTLIAALDGGQRLVKTE
jgi:nitrogen fixation NifU-like protein